MDGTGWWTAGVRPHVDAHGALVYTFTAWQAVFAAICAMMALYALARLAARLLARERPMTVEAISLFLGYSAAQGIIALAVTRGFRLKATFTVTVSRPWHPAASVTVRI